MNSTTIVEDTAGRLFSVVAAPDGLEHIWMGVPVKRVRGEYVPKAIAKAVSVHKAGCRMVVSPLPGAPEQYKPHYVA
jgi:hypothetical protein